MDEVITKNMLNEQAYKFFLAPFLWILYLLFIPYCFYKAPLISLVLVVFPGSYLFCWLCYLMHESWHHYLPYLPNKFLFKLYAWLIFSDPQVYAIVHPTHHRHPHSYEDLEFHPLGFIKNKHLRRLHNVLELLLGMIYIYNVTAIALSMRKHPKYSQIKALISGLIILILFSPLLLTSHYWLGVPSLTIVISWLVTVLFAGWVQHTNQIIQHGGIFTSADAHSNHLTRNLRNEGIIGRIFIFLTHWDAYEHVLHHSEVKYYTRPYPHKIPMPKDAVYVSMKDYWKIAKIIIKEDEQDYVKSN